MDSGPATRSASWAKHSKEECGSEAPETRQTIARKRPIAALPKPESDARSGPAAGRMVMQAGPPGEVMKIFVV